MAYKYKRRRKFFRILQEYIKKKGFKTSVRKACIKAMEEENQILNLTNQYAITFLTYVLVKAYMRYYKWFTRKIYFKKNQMKFILYSLDMFIPPEGKSAFQEIKKDLKELSKDVEKVY